MNIRGIYKTSLIDFPGRISTVLFSGGCNLRCKFCYNPELACSWRRLELSSNEDAFDLLRKRERIIDGVTLSGGEPTLSKNIDSFIEKIKELSLDVKLDSNGLKPEVIERLVKKNLIDYAAIDIKTSPQKYNDLTNSEVDFSKIVESVNILRECGIDYEIRTTCIPEYVTRDDLESIKSYIGFVDKYYLQQFMSSVPLIDRTWEEIQPYPVKILYDFREFVLTFSEICEIRGV